MKVLKASVLMTTLLFSAVMMLGILALRVDRARGAGGGAVPTTKLNGDVNCDGRRNITDAVGLLRHLFQGGPEPCALAQEAGCCPEMIDEIKGLRVDLAAKWPPRPEAMVNLSGSIDVRVGSGSPIYTVPDDKFFILTSMEVADSSITISESIGTTTTKKIFHGGTSLVLNLGLRFNPGSKVFLTLSGNGCPGDDRIPCGKEFWMIGYLVSQ